MHAHGFAACEFRNIRRPDRVGCPARRTHRRTSGSRTGTTCTFAFPDCAAHLKNASHMAATVMAPFTSASNACSSSSSFSLSLASFLLAFPLASAGGCRRCRCTTPLVACSTRPLLDGAFEGLLLTKADRKTDRGLRKRLPFLETLVASAIAARVFNQCSLLESNQQPID